MRRVLVVHGDGSQRVYQIKDDHAGYGKFDMNFVTRALSQLGVTDIADVKVAGLEQGFVKVGEIA